MTEAATSCATASIGRELALTLHHDDHLPKQRAQMG